MREVLNLDGWMIGRSGHMVPGPVGTGSQQETGNRGLTSFLTVAGASLLHWGPRQVGYGC